MASPTCRAFGGMAQLLAWRRSGVSKEIIHGPREFDVQDLTRLARPDSPPLTASYIVEPGDGKIPYQPWAAKKRDEFIANMVAPTKLEHIDPHARAWLDGVPRVNHAPGEIQVVQGPGYVL